MTWLPWPLSTLGHRLGRILFRLDTLVLEVSQMPTKADFDAAIATVNEHLDGITADLASLKQQLQDAINASGGGLSAADAQAVLDSVTALATKAGAIDAGQ